MPASQHPLTAQAAQCVPSKYVGGAQKTQPFAPSTYWPGGQSARQSRAEVAPGSDTMPAGHEVGVQALASASAYWPAGQMEHEPAGWPASGW